MRVVGKVTCGWFDQKPSNVQLNNLEQHPPFTWRSEQTNIDDINGYICYFMIEDGLPYGKKAAVNYHQMQSLPYSLMNSLQSKEDVELFQMYNMEELDVQDDLNYDHIDVKVRCLKVFYQFSFLRFINNTILFHFYIRKC